MKKDKIELKITLGKVVKSFEAGRASLNEVEDWIKSNTWQIFTARPIMKGGEAPWVNRGVRIDGDWIEKFRDREVRELDVVLFPPGVPYSEALLNRVVKELDEKREAERRSYEEKAIFLRDSFVAVYRKCAAVFSSLVGRPIQDLDKLDEAIAKQVVALGDDINRLYPAILQATEELLDGEGRIIANIEGIQPPEDEQARGSLTSALNALKTGHNFNAILARGSLGCIYADIQPFDIGGLAKIFLAGLLRDIGLWGGQEKYGHEKRGAALINLLITNGCKLPPDLADLVRDHSGRWTDYYVYRTGAGEVSLQIASSGQISQVVGTSGVLTLDQVSNRHILEVVLVNLLEELEERQRAGEETSFIFEEMVGQVKVSTFLKYDPGRDINQGLPLCSYVLAAIVETLKLKILPAGAILEFIYEGRSKLAHLLGLDGGIAIFLGGRVKGAWLLTHRQAGGVELERPETTVQGLTAITQGSNRLPRQRFIPLTGITQVYTDMRTLVVGFMDDATFKRRGFDKVEKLIHQFRAHLETPSQTAGRNSVNSVTK